MTHPTPTAAPHAPPLPRRGEGVAGHPRRVRIHCAPWLALALLLATPTFAQIIPTGTPAADILLSQALTEHRVFLTCSTLEPQTHGQILSNWERDTAAAVAILAANKVPQDAIAAFTKAAKPENLLPAPGTPFQDVKQLCDNQPDWMARYYQFNLTVLELKLPQALE